MNSFELRPLSLGEILDRTFTLYRTYFGMFVGIAAIPRVLVLVLSLAQILVRTPMGITLGRTGQPNPPDLTTAMGGMLAYAVLATLTFIVTILAELLAEGGTIVAVSEIYAGRTIAIVESFRRVRGRLGTLLALLILTILAVFAGAILLIIPGIYIACRLMTSVPAAIAEDLGPTEAMSRSFSLTSDNAGRAFVILVLYFALSIGGAMLFAMPFQVGVVLSRSNPRWMMFWLAMVQVGTFASGVLVTPVLTIAAAVFYYDLRIRKEAFDLQMLMAPLAAAPASGVVPTVLS